MTNAVAICWFTFVAAFVEVIANDFIYCGAGPHLLSRNSKASIVYQLENQSVVFEAQDLMAGLPLQWIASVGDSAISEVELAEIANGDKIRATSFDRRSRLTVTVDALLNGTQYQFGFEDARGTIIYQSEATTVNIGEPASILLRNIAVEGDKGSVSIGGSYAGVPTPSVVLRYPNGSKIHKSHYSYSDEWWHLNSSIAQTGGLFILSASNCLSTINTSFVVNVRPRVDLQLSKSTGCIQTECKTHYLVIRQCQDVVIPLFVQGFPVPRIRLLLHNRDTSVYTMLSNNKQVSINTTHFILRSARFGDIASYRVELENILGSEQVTFDIEVTDDDSRLSQCHNQSDSNIVGWQDCHLPVIRASSRNKDKTCRFIKIKTSDTGTSKSKLPYATSDLAQTTSHTYTDVLSATIIPVDADRNKDSNSSNVTLWVPVIGITGCCLLAVAISLMLYSMIRRGRIRRENREKQQQKPKWYTDKCKDTKVSQTNKAAHYATDENKTNPTSRESHLASGSRKKNEDSNLYPQSQPKQLTLTSSRQQQDQTPEYRNITVSYNIRDKQSQSREPMMVNEKHQSVVFGVEEQDQSHTIRPRKATIVKFSAQNSRQNQRDKIQIQ